MINVFSTFFLFRLFSVPWCIIPITDMTQAGNNYREKRRSFSRSNTNLILYINIKQYTNRITGYIQYIIYVTYLCNINKSIKNLAIHPPERFPMSTFADVLLLTKNE